MLMADALVLPVSLLAAAWLVTPQVVDLLPAWVWVIPVVVGLVGLRFGGAYRSVVRFMGFELVVTAFQALTLAAIALLLATASVDNWPDGLRVSATFWLLGMVYVVGGRLTVRWFLQSRNAAGDRVVIYGAGDAGAHLRRRHCEGAATFVPVAFVDDNSALHRVSHQRSRGASAAGSAEPHRRVRRVARAAGAAVRFAPAATGDHQPARATSGARADDARHGRSRRRQRACRRHPRGRYHGPARSRCRCRRIPSCSTPAFAASRSW